MAILGIEGTAHTLGVGVVEPEEGRPGRCRVLSNVRDMLRPEEGGIHPREAAHHHSEVGPSVLAEALAAAGVEAGDLEGVAFSQGPGLGPCLRVAATMARALSLRHDLPLLGVNHCVAHLEIGRALSDAVDPVLLYASGANTQVIAHVRGRYRVFGETLDVGIGNALDKFARDQGIPFPGGPEIERLALGADHDRLLPLPYVVKGMDTSFAGLVTAAQRLVQEGQPLAAVCHAIQETAFAALLEVAERALAHVQRDELVLGGGVACNQRLQDMARIMCEDRGATMHCPPRPLLVDNGAMIAWLGHLKLQAGDTTPLASSVVLPHQRTDMVDARWLPSPDPVRPAAGAGSFASAAVLADGFVQGAEAHVESSTLLGRAAVAKTRAVKRYRHPLLDRSLREARTRDEAHLLVSARRAGVHVPVVYDIDRGASRLVLERVEGPSLRRHLSGCSDREAETLMAELGAATARLHQAGLTHGDLTTSNVLFQGPGSLVLIDFGLGRFTPEAEAHAVDLHLMEEALEATDPRADSLVAALLGGYRWPGAAAVLARLEAVRGRGRYR